MKNTIHIKESKKGTFTAAAKKRGLGVQSFASKVLANKGNYSSAMVKKANFAKNASKWQHAFGGPIIGEENNIFANGGAIHTVSKGDTLWQLGKKFGMDWKEIAAANGIKDPKALQIGTKLVIPDKGNTYSGGSLPEVTVTAKREQNFKAAQTTPKQERRYNNIESTPSKPAPEAKAMAKLPKGLNMYSQSNVIRPVLTGNNTFRSGNVSPKDALKFKEENPNVRTVVYLKGENENKKGSNGIDAATLKDMGFNVQYLPIGTLSSKGEKANFKKAVDLVKQGDAWVMCEHGYDRTGAVCAQAGIDAGFSKEQVIENNFWKSGENIYPNIQGKGSSYQPYADVLNKAKFDVGGEIKTISSLATKLGAVSPVLGAAGMATDLILTAIENGAKPNDTRNLLNNTNPYGLAMGGDINMTKVNIEGGETISDSKKGQSLFIAKGPRHEQGGIDIQANGGIVKSDRIGYDKNGRITIDESRVKNTFASVDKKINNALSGMNDKIAKTTQKLMLQKTENDNVAVTSILDKINEYKCGGKIKKMAPGGLILPSVIDALKTAYNNSTTDTSTKAPSPGYNIFDPYLNPFGELLSTDPNPNQTFTPPSTTDLVGGEAMPAYEVSKKTKLLKPPKQADIPYGEQMSMFGALSGGIYSAAQGLLSKAEKERPRLINTQFQKNYYNPNEELRASKAGLNTALRGIGTGGVGNANRLAAAAGFMNQQSDIARRKFNYDTSVDQMASNFNLQRDSANAQILAATDVANAQNRAQTRNLRRQGIGNLAQSIANVGDYKNRQLEQKMKIGLLDDIFANYGITADNIPNLMKMLLQGDFYKKPEENN